MSFELSDSLRALYPSLEAFTLQYLKNLGAHRAESMKFLAALAQISESEVADYPFCFQIAKQVTVMDLPPGVTWALPSRKTKSFSSHEREMRRTNLPEHGGFCAAYVVVNKTDGKGGKAENITDVRALFVELDHGGLSESHILEFIDNFKPSIVIESSPGKLHCYWLLQSLVCPLEHFQWCQIQLQDRFSALRAGPESKDLPRILRVPGFLHLKDLNRPFVVKLHHCDSSVVYTSIQEVFAICGIAAEVIQNISSQAAKVSAPCATAPISGEYLGSAEGSRNGALFNFCYETLFQRRNLPFNDALTLAFANNAKNVPPLPEDEVKSIVISAYKRYAAKAPKVSACEEEIYTPPVATDVLTEWKSCFDYTTSGMSCPISDESLADRMIQVYGSDINHSTIGGFYVYNGLIWANANGEGKQLVSKYMREVFQGVPQEESVRAYFSTDKLHNAFKRDIHSAVRRRAAMELLAQRIEIATTLDQFNREEESDVIACPNGILDLSKGRLVPSDPKYRLTHVMGAAFDPKIACPKWLEFISSCMGRDADLIKYVQKVTGYFLSGRTHLQCLFVAYGPPGTGKSVYLGTLEKLLGGYFKELHKNTLISNSGSENAKMSSLAQAVHCRLATIEETSLKDSWDESLVKQISGNDPVTAKLSHKDTIVFHPRFKICIRANNLPSSDQLDEGLWTRLKFLPFEVRFRGTARDNKFLSGELALELSGILNWAVKGYQMLMAEGLGEPKLALQQKEDAQKDAEPIRMFLECCCVPCDHTDKEALSIDAFWQAFGVFCRSEGKSDFDTKSKSKRLLKELEITNKSVNVASKTTRRFNRRLKTPEEKAKDQSEYSTSDNVIDIMGKLGV